MLGDHEDTLPGLKSADDGTGIRHRMLLAFEYAESEPDPVEQARLLTVVVVGGGASGIEIAGELAEFANRTLAQDLYSIPADAVRIVLLEAKPRLLPGHSAEIAARKRELLEKNGVTVRLGTQVDAVASDHVVASGERVEARTVVWAAASAPPAPVVEERARPELLAALRDTVAAFARQLATTARLLLAPNRQTTRA